MSDEPQAWIEIDGKRYPVRGAWIVPLDAEYVTTTDDGTPVFWRADHLEPADRLL